MLGRRFAASFALAASLLASCETSRSEEEFKATAPVAVTDEAKAAARAANASAFDLYGRLKDSEGNLLFSPASISTALAMAYAGAGGETKAEMAAALHLGGSDEAVQAGFGTLSKILNSGGAGYRLRSANRLFAAEGYPLRPAFVGGLEKRYGAEPVTLDFAASEAARGEINDWVSEQTNGRIEDLIARGVLTADTRLVLANAVHFKARWADEFHPRGTNDAAFRLAGGGETTTPLMHQKDDFRYAEAEGLQVLELPYFSAPLSMVVLLPEEVGLDGLEAKLTAEAVDEWVEKLGEREVDLFLPRFKTTASLSLADTLAALGMPQAFDPKRADFSGMTSDPQGLYLSAVVHKAFIAVDEEGTEAAAATAAVAATASLQAGAKSEPVVFRADRPFVYLIRDNRTGAVLFLGRLVDPRG